jgi:hypothetical protein
METASKTGIRFHRHVNGGFLEGVKVEEFAPDIGAE